MTSMITINLPEEAIVSQSFDPDSQQLYCNLTIAKRDIPYFVKFLLGGISTNEKDQVSIAAKEDIAKAAGLKYVYRRPSIVRTLLLGTACGVAIKTLATQNVSLLKTGINSKVAIALQTFLNGVDKHPYLTALSLAGTSLATKLGSDTISNRVSGLLERFFPL